MVVRALFSHECHDRDTQRLLLSWSFGRYLGRYRRHAHRSFLVGRALAELPSKEGEEDKEEQEGWRDLQSADKHCDVYRPSQ